MTAYETREIDKIMQDDDVDEAALWETESGDESGKQNRSRRFKAKCIDFASENNDEAIRQQMIKRKRNAEAAKRFRKRKKEKDKAMIDELRYKVQNLEALVNRLEKERKQFETKRTEWRTNQNHYINLLESIRMQFKKQKEYITQLEGMLRVYDASNVAFSMRENPRNSFSSIPLAPPPATHFLAMNHDNREIGYGSFAQSIAPVNDGFVNPMSLHDS